MKRVIAATLLTVGLHVAPAIADPVVDAKMQCQVEYGPTSDMGTACKEGVDIARRAEPGTDAMGACIANRNNGAQISACQQGVMLHGRYVGQVRNSDKSSFSYTWKQPTTGLTVDVGPAQASVGNQKAMEDCMRQFDGSGTPPSCMAGITVQPQPPAAAPARK